MHHAHRLLRRPRSMAIIAGGSVRARVAPYRLQGDAITVTIQHIIGDGLAVRITWGTGVTWGMLLLSGAHTPSASRTGVPKRT